MNNILYNALEILLGDKSFCCLCTTDLNKFNGRYEDLKRAIYIISRANYRQTCVNLDDGILQRSWHELAEFLHLMGVSLTGFITWEYQNDAVKLNEISDVAQYAADSMADELNLPKAKAIQTLKPEGSSSKVLDSTEGIHRPLGRYIINRIRFSAHDPIVELLESASYDVMTDPYDDTSKLVAFPVEYENVEFTKVTLEDGRVLEVNQESAVDQLNRYKFVMDNYVKKHNASNTISYSPEEVPAIVDWIHENWDSYVGVSFLYRNDPTKTAADLGFPYLPQTCVSKEEYEAYVSRLKPFDLDAGNTLLELEDEACATGACPVR